MYSNSVFASDRIWSKKNSSHHIVHILHYIFSRLRAKSSQSRKTMRKKNKYMKIKSSKSLIFFSKQKHKKKLKICTPTLSNKIPDGDEILDLKKRDYKKSTFKIWARAVIDLFLKFHLEQKEIHSHYHFGYICALTSFPHLVGTLQAGKEGAAILFDKSKNALKTNKTCCRL